MKYVLSIIFIINGLVLLAQPTGFNNAYQNDTFSTQPYYDTKFYGLEISDTAYYVMGMGLDSNVQYTASNFPWHRTGLFMQMNINGQVQKKRLFKKDSLSMSMRLNCFIKTHDNYLLIAGRDDTNAILYKINDIGDTLWTQYYRPDSLHLFQPLSIRIAKDNGYYFLLQTFDYTTGSQDLLRGTILKIDSIGNEQWRSEYIPAGFKVSLSNNVIEIDSHLVFIGNKSNGNIQLDFNYKTQVFIRKIDNAGNLVAEYSSSLNRYIAVGDGIQTKDKGFVFCGGEGTQLSIGGAPHMIFRGYVAKVDSNLQLVWEKGFGLPDNTMHLIDIEELDDGSLIMVGHRSTFFPDGFYSNADSSHSNGWILKMSANGDSLWQRLHRNDIETWYNYQTLADIEVLPDGGFIAVGHIEKTLSNHPDYRYHGWLIRTDSFGCIVPGCQLLDNTTTVSVLFDNEVTVFPNPASEVVRFRFDKTIDEDTEIRVYSGLGQLVEQMNVDYLTEAEMNVSDWNSGIYHYGIYVEGRLVKQGQILVQH